MFKLVSSYQPAGSQPEAIDSLIKGLADNQLKQTLLGVTGSGKTFTIANVIAKTQRPTLVISHNKTLAAQLTNEFRQFFPENAVEYFVSYYDYYQPEAYVPGRDLYIEKEAQINEEIDRLRHSATQAILSRRDVIIVASVSCIYGIGSKESYQQATIELAVGQELARADLIRQLVELQYQRNETELRRGTFRSKGNTVELMPTNREIVIRLELDRDGLTLIEFVDPINRASLSRQEQLVIFSAKHFVANQQFLPQALSNIELELAERLKQLEAQGKPLEAERLKRRTRYDLAMIRELGYCTGIENYSRQLEGRVAGSSPTTLLDYFPEDFLVVIDESHVTLPQLNGMYAGDRARKDNLIDYGFRLPSAADNRPLKYTEFEAKLNQVIYVSATPGEYELESSNQVVEQLIRPTGLLDPELVVRPAKDQVQDFVQEVTAEVKLGRRVLATTLPRKMAEDLAGYLNQTGLKARFLHYEVETLDRIETLRDLRQGKYDCLIGVNLLREGLDLPEVSLVAILDADKEGFLRSTTSLIQIIGRAARNLSGRVLLYADTITPSLARAIDETNRRREIQANYNKEHNISPESILKNISSIADGREKPNLERQVRDWTPELLIHQDIEQVIKSKQAEMKLAARELQFELAALLRDEIQELRAMSRESRRV